MMTGSWILPFCYRLPFQCHPTMPTQLLPHLQDAKMDRHGIAQIHQHVVEHKGLPQAGPWKKQPTKRAQVADPNNNFHRTVEGGTGFSAPLPFSRPQLFEEFRQRAETKQDREPTKPHTHMRGEQVLEPRFPQLTELHCPFLSFRLRQVTSATHLCGSIDSTSSYGWTAENPCHESGKSISLHRLTGS